MDLESFIHLRTHIWKSLREEKSRIGIETLQHFRGTNN